jgi:hypothetical protein
MVVKEKMSGENLEVISLFSLYFKLPISICQPKNRTPEKSGIKVITF